jgi:hypothetical protein
MQALYRWPAPSLFSVVFSSRFVILWNNITNKPNVLTEFLSYDTISGRKQTAKDKLFWQLRYGNQNKKRQ